MKLRDKEFKPSYDTNFDSDVVSDFYIPALSSSVEYKRMSGFFSSSSLYVAAEGIAEFIRNDGVMKLITCPYLSKKDIEMLDVIDGEHYIDSVVTDNFLNVLDAETIREDHVEAFAWMLANNRLEIRIVLVIDDNGKIMDAERVNASGIFHNKVGILSDGSNTIAFSGSINETYAGWKENIENFQVYCDWEGLERYIRPLENRFEEYWALGKKNRSRTIKLPEAVRDRWIKTAPAEKEDLRVFKKEGSSHIKLRDYQKTAIDNWFTNNCRGFFNMATGTGKTITAIHAIKRLIKENKGKFVVIAVPYQHLLHNPWLETLERELRSDYENVNIILAYGGNKHWRSQLGEAIEEINFGISDHQFVLTTYDTYSSDDFIRLIKEIRGKKTIVADEVHNAGAEVYRLGLLEEYQYRLGLSATPTRYFDEEGSEFLIQYFGEEVFTFSLPDAIKKINPSTGQSFLTPYKYHPIFVTLTQDELDSYREFSKKIAHFANKKELTPEEIKKRDFLRMLRARILKNAENKLASLDEVFSMLGERDEMHHCLVYCSDGKDPDEGKTTLSCVVEKLNELGISNRRFTAAENSLERQDILKSFESGETNILVAIKCLDEGIDVPATRNAVIMASTGNPREYIQRRGRVLRRSKGKEFAVIYDFIVVPGADEFDKETEKQILLSEYKRFKEFSDNALNREENERIISEVMTKNGIRLG